MDGDVNTYAKTEENAPGEWSVDLEGAHTISRIQFTNAISRQFDIFLIDEYYLELIVIFPVTMAIYSFLFG